MNDKPDLSLVNFGIICGVIGIFIALFVLAAGRTWGGVFILTCSLLILIIAAIAALDQVRRGRKD